MADYKLTTTVEQETALTAVVTSDNDGKPTQISPAKGPYTNESYLQALLNLPLNKFVNAVNEKDKNDLVASYTKATDAQKKAAKAILAEPEPINPQ